MFLLAWDFEMSMFPNIAPYKTESIPVAENGFFEQKTDIQENFPPMIKLLSLNYFTPNIPLPILLQPPLINRN